MHTNNAYRNNAYRTITLTVQDLVADNVTLQDTILKELRKTLASTPYSDKDAIQDLLEAIQVAENNLVYLTEGRG